MAAAAIAIATTATAASAVAPPTVIYIDRAALAEARAKGMTAEEKALEVAKVPVPYAELLENFKKLGPHGFLPESVASYIESHCGGGRNVEACKLADGFTSGPIG